MSVKNYIYIHTAVLLLLILFITGCTPQDKKAEGPSSSTETQEAASGPEQIDQEKKTYAIVYPLLHPFFAETNRGAREAAEKLDVNLILVGPHHYSVPEQIIMMEKLIESGVDGIGLGAFDPVELNPVINKAIDAGINVICFDTDAPDSKRLSFISTDNFQQGVHLAQITADILDGEGKVIISQGVPTQLNLTQRLDGVRSYLSNYPEIEVLSVVSGYGNHEQTIASIEKMIDEHPDFDALIGLDAQAGPSAAVVWRSRGLQQHLIVSEDMPETIKAIRDNIVSATIAQEQYRWGRLIIERLEQASMGKTLEPRETTATKLITIENVEKIYPSGRQ